MARFRGATKATRLRLARAELRLSLAAVTEEWAKRLERAGTGEGVHRYPSVDEWPKDDHLRRLLDTYGLEVPDVAKVLRVLGGDLEWAAERGGLGETWD